MSKHKCRPWRPGLQLRYAHVKRDGIWLRVEHGRAYSSHPTDLTDQLMHVSDTVNQACSWSEKENWTFLGELYYPGKPASYVKSAMKQRDPALRFECFAIDDLDADKSMLYLQEACDDMNVPFAPWFDLRDIAADEPFDLEEEASRIQDCEGWVLKNGNLLDWYKWKPVRTVDLVCTGFLDGNGKYLGLVGSVLGSLYPDREVARVGGMDDAERIEMTINEEKYVGRVFEAEYQYVGSGGRLRHPRFKRWRDDKLPSECSADQDPAWEGES